MKTYLFSIIFLLICQSVFSQTQSDTTLYLQNVTVEGKRFAGLSSGGIKRLEVEHNLSTLSVTAADAFRQLPSVITDIEGGVNYRGSNRASLLLNGVPYGLLEEYSGDVLIQLPSLFFNHIALTSFPPILMIPDGDVGTLDLSSSLYTSQDSPLQVTLGAGLQERYNAGMVVNLHPGKFHIIGKYNYRREFRERKFDKTTTNSGGTTIMNNNASSRPDVHLADLSVGYDLTPNDLLTVYGLYHLMEYDRYGGINNTRKNPAGEVINKILRHRFNRQQQDAYALEGRWQHRFDNPTDKIEVFFNYNNFKYDEKNNFKNEKPETGAILAEDRSCIGHSKNNYYVSASLQKLLLNEWLLKAGYTGRFRDEEYKAEAYDKKGEVWVRNEQKLNDYSFDRNIHLLYASIEKTFGQLKADVGLQLEFPLHLYPRIKLAYPVRNTDEITLSYIQRAIRPYGMDLNPFIDYTDATYVKQGNPDLEDEFIHSLEASYQLRLPRVHISPSFYYRNRRNRIMDVATNYQEQMVWRKENLGNSQTVGFELSANWNPLQIVTLGLSGDIYRDEIDGRVIGYDEKKSMVCWDVKGNIILSITPSTDLQIDGFYVSDQLTPQGKIKDRYSVNAGVSQYLMNRKLRLNFSIQNIFDSLGETTIIDAENLQMEQIRNRDSRVTWLTVTYSL